MRHFIRACAIRKTGIICLFTVIAAMSYAQRPFSDASPFTDVRAEELRLDSLGYRAAFEYELADTAEPNGRRYLIGRYEYGVDGVVALRIEYGFDTDSTAWYYAYDTKGRVTQSSMISRRGIIQKSYSYNKKTGRIDHILVNAGETFKYVARYDKKGILTEFDVRRVENIADSSGKKVKFKRVEIPFERILFAYDTTSHPIADTTYTTGGQMKSASAYSYDAAGRMVSRSIHEPGNAVWTDSYSYDERGSLFRRIHADLTTGERKHFVMFYK